jgi:hypothetical protein
MVVMEELSPMCEGRGCDERVGLASERIEAKWPRGG